MKTGNWNSQRGSAMVLAMMGVCLITMLAIALATSTTMELKIAGSETIVNKAFYAADSGIEWGAARLRASPSFAEASGGGVFAVPAGVPNVSDVAVTLARPVFVAQAPVAGSQFGQWWEISYELASTAVIAKSSDKTEISRKTIVATVGVSPLPTTLEP